MSTIVKHRKIEQRRRITRVIGGNLKRILNKNLCGALVYGSVLNSDYSDLSDFDILIILKKASFVDLKKLSTLKQKYALKGINIDFNVHIEKELPNFRKNFFWHNNRSLYIQKELALYGEVIAGKKIFKDIKLDYEAMKIEAVRVVGSLLYQARKILINKDPSNEEYVRLMKMCIYASLYALAAENIYPTNRKEAMEIFNTLFPLLHHPKHFLNLKIDTQKSISSKNAKVAYGFLSALDIHIYIINITSMELKLVNDTVAISYFSGEKKEAVVFCSGLPQYPTQYHPFVKTLQKIGVHVFLPKYSGTWESEGGFGVQQAAEDIKNTVNFVREGNAIELFNNQNISWEVDKIYLIGFSFGALPAILSQAKADKIILIEPFVNWQIHKKHGEADLKDTVAFMQRAYKNVYRFNPEKFFLDLDALEYPNLDIPMVVAKGTKDDKVISSEEIDWLKNSYNSDLHEFAGGHTANMPEDSFRALLS